MNALSSGGQVPAALVAKMLKYTVLKQRTLDLARQEALRKVGLVGMLASIYPMLAML